MQQLASVRGHKKMALSLMCLKEGPSESLKIFMGRFNIAFLEVPTAIDEVKINALTIGLQDGDLLKSLAKHPSQTFDKLLEKVVK
ncbi:hypothetical protein ACS0TY_005501 [Phlomoides rotata]